MTTATLLKTLTLTGILTAASASAGNSGGNHNSNDKPTCAPTPVVRTNCPTVCSYPPPVVCTTITNTLTTTNSACFGNFGTNITTWDKLNAFQADPFNADGIIFPGLVFNPLQAWDLEGMFVECRQTLALVGGYDFVNGAFAVNERWSPGDIFLATSGNAVWGTNTVPGPIYPGISPLEKQVYNVFGYDYVVRFHRDAATTLGSPLDEALVLTNFSSGAGLVPFDVYQIAADARLFTVHYYETYDASPFRFDETSPGTLVYSGYALYQTGLSDAQTGFAGDAEIGAPSHFSLELDLASFLTTEQITNLFAHYTMRCGNDILDGKASLPVTTTTVTVTSNSCSGQTRTNICNPPPRTNSCYRPATNPCPQPPTCNHYPNRDWVCTNLFEWPASPFKPCATGDTWNNDSNRRSRWNGHR